MPSYSFNNKCRVQIEGKMFEIDTSSSDVITAVAVMVNKCAELKKHPELGYEERSLLLRQICVDHLNVTLGENNLKKIIDDKVVDQVDLLGLCNFINDSIAEFKMKKMKEYIDRVEHYS